MMRRLRRTHRANAGGRIDGTPAARCSKNATNIPIVFNIVDPLGAGFVANLARPGGNVTGSQFGRRSGGKRLELLNGCALTAAHRVALSIPTSRRDAIIRAGGRCLRLRLFNAWSAGRF